MNTPAKVLIADDDDDFREVLGVYLSGEGYKIVEARDGAEVFDINKINEIPSGYEVERAKSSFERKLWQKFWQYALDSKEAKRMGVKNAQIEAPGTRFIPGIIYTIKIEHDGGLRIDSQPIPPVLKDKKPVF